MKLTKNQAKQLRDIDFVEAARKARKESAQLFDQLINGSDQSHAVSAFLSGCNCMITYDSHFDAIKEQLPVLTPEFFLKDFNSKYPPKSKMQKNPSF